jgi:hypothetical protein
LRTFINGRNDRADAFAWARTSDDILLESLTANER